MASLPVVALVGRPNVGKSTLFNRIVGDPRAAIVEDRARTTRDRLYAEADWNGRSFLVVDTGGLETAPGDAIEAKVQEQARLAIGEADVIVFLLDATTGITPADTEAAEMLRRASAPVLLAPNKADNAKRELDAVEFWALGWPESWPISAAHGRGVADLLDAIVEALPPETPEERTRKVREARQDMAVAHVADALAEGIPPFDEAGADADEIRRSLILLDSKGLLGLERPGLDDDKREFALNAAELASLGLAAGADLLRVVQAVRPAILIGTTATPSTFTEPIVRAMAETCPHPIILPLSNPTSRCEATPAQVLAWTDGRALVATGSPFDPVVVDGTTRQIGQANNAFIFPGVGLAAIIAGARTVSDAQFLVAARTLAALVSDERLAEGALYPSIGDLRAVSREIAVAVLCSFGTLHGVPLPAGDEGRAHAEAAVDQAMWWPEYLPYEPA